MERRVVITGMGAVSSIGCGMDAFWSGLVAGRNGIGPVTLFDASGLPGSAGEVRDLQLNDVTPKDLRRMIRSTRFAVAAADEAMRAAGFARGDAERGGDPFRFGALFANASGGVDEYERNFELLAKRGPGAVSAFFMPKFISNGVAGTLAIRWGLRGPNFNPVTACASGAHAIGEALWMIRRGDADLMLAGGAEACLTRLMMSGFHALTALSRILPPEHASRPFDLHRDGFVMAEGAGALVLEELEHARRRGATILAELAGYGATCDAVHITGPAPDGAGLSRAMRRALEMAGATHEDVDAYYAHGTGTVVNDRVEAAALRAVFGSRTDMLKVTAVKSMIGHAISASGPLAAAAAIQTLNTGVLPPTVNYETPDPACPLAGLSDRAAELDARGVLVGSLGFGGHNAALLFRRFDG